LQAVPIDVVEGRSLFQVRKDWFAIDHILQPAAVALPSATPNGRLLSSLRAGSLGPSMP
jgi:hypothetical protein